MTEEIWTQLEQYNYITYQLTGELLYNIYLRLQPSQTIKQLERLDKKTD